MIPIESTAYVVFRLGGVKQAQQDAAVLRFPF
jgi:hypothetical protein